MYLNFTVLEASVALFEQLGASGWNETPHLSVASPRASTSVGLTFLVEVKALQKTNDLPPSELFEVGAFFCRPVSGDMHRDHKSGVKINKTCSSCDVQLLRRTSFVTLEESEDERLCKHGRVISVCVYEWVCTWARLS